MQYIPISLIQSSSVQEEYITTKFLFPFRKKSSKMDFVKMLLGLTASHLGGLAVCALYAGTWRKDHTLHGQTTECIYIKPHSVGRWDFSLNGRPGRDEEV